MSERAPAWTRVTFAKRGVTLIGGCVLMWAMFVLLLDAPADEERRAAPTVGELPDLEQVPRGTASRTATARDATSEARSGVVSSGDIGSGDPDPLRSVGTRGIAEGQGFSSGGGLLVRLEGRSPAQMRPFAVTAIDNPYPGNPSSWSPMGDTMVRGGGLCTSQAVDGEAFIPYFGSPRVAILVMSPGAAHFVVENVACSEPGLEPSVEVIHIPERECGCIEGLVVGSRGDPWPHGKVVFIPDQGSANHALNKFYASAASEAPIGADGRFALDALSPTTSGRLELRAGSQTVHHREPVAVVARQTTHVLISLPPLKPCFVVVHYGGAPVEGIQVAAVPRGEEVRPENFVVATDSGGVAEFLVPDSCVRVSYRLAGMCAMGERGALGSKVPLMAAGFLPAQRLQDVLDVLTWKTLGSSCGEIDLTSGDTATVEMLETLKRVAVEGPGELGGRLNEMARGPRHAMDGIPHRVVEAIRQKDLRTLGAWLFLRER